MLPTMRDLTDDVIVLRPWCFDDADWYATQSREVEIQRNTAEPAELTAESAAKAIARYAGDPRYRGGAIRGASTGELLGNASLDLATGHVSYWVAAAARGRGVATRAVRLMTACAFETSDLDELRLWVRAGNNASANVARKAGFVRAPELDRDVAIRDELWSAEYYRLTRAAHTSLNGDDPTVSLADGWNSHAHEWIAWSRSGLDSYQSHREVFMPLIPSPGHLTVDIGCGEGRVSRDLQAMGHRVLAIDRSPAMGRAAAAHPVEPVPAIVADATELPLAIGTADCAVAFMSLHDIDDMPAAIREIARVLTIGGHLVMAIVHPINSAGHFPGDKDNSSRPFVIDESYTQPKRYVTTRAREGLTMTYHGEHRPLQAYTEALTDAGFVINRLREPTSADTRDKWHRIPLFLHILASLQQRNPQ
jgi:RimJ/RimL family protein N-acetyltransferase/SAM-dependent methyltransferase